MSKLQRYLLPSVLVFLLAGAIAGAQTINKALQLSQDASGAFGIDTTNNVYFPGHILNIGSGGPAPTVAGTGTPTLGTGSTDVAGTITMGTSATTATVTFGRAYVTVPHCTVTWQSIPNGTAISYTLLTTSVNVVQPAGSANKINYFCTSLS